MLVLFIFPPGDIILTFLAIVTGSGPVEFPLKVFVSGDLPSVKFLLAQKPFVHELVHKAVLKVNPHGRMDGPVVVVIVAHAGIIGGPCLSGIADKREQAGRGRRRTVNEWISERFCDILRLTTE